MVAGHQVEKRLLQPCRLRVAQARPAISTLDSFGRLRSALDRGTDGLTTRGSLARFVIAEYLRLAMTDVANRIHDDGHCQRYDRVARPRTEPAEFHRRCDHPRDQRGR